MKERKKDIIEWSDYSYQFERAENLRERVEHLEKAIKTHKDSIDASQSNCCEVVEVDRHLWSSL